jgi:hypothetical protein
MRVVEERKLVNMEFYSEPEMNQNGATSKPSSTKANLLDNYDEEVDCVRDHEVKIYSKTCNALGDHHQVASTKSKNNACSLLALTSLCLLVVSLFEEILNYNDDDDEEDYYGTTGASNHHRMFHFIDEAYTSSLSPSSSPIVICAVIIFASAAILFRGIVSELPPFLQLDYLPEAMLVAICVLLFAYQYVVTSFLTLTACTSVLLSLALVGRILRIFQSNLDTNQKSC